MQEDNLERVTARIGATVLRFCQMGLKRSPPRFHMEELLAYCRREFGEETIAPDSPSRILRHLRQRGLVSYVVISRSESLYELVKRPAAPLKGFRHRE